MITHPNDNITKSETEIEKVMKTVAKFKGIVFYDERIGKMVTPPIHLEYDVNYIPEQP